MELQVLQTFASENALILISVFLISVALIWKLAYAPFSYLKNLGIPGPKPWPFLGNLPELIKKKEDFHAHQDFIKQYGRLCGYYQGQRAVILIAEPEMVKQILVKEFSKFVNRPIPAAASIPPTDKGLLQLADDDWRRLRNTITPTFSAVKLKHVVPLINDACRILVEQLGLACKSGKSIDVFRTYGNFTMETIVCSAFGIDCNSQTDPNDPFVPHAKRLFADIGLPVYMSALFPIFRPVIKLLVMLGATKKSERGQSVMYLVEAARQMVKLRRESGTSPRKDVLELMLSAEMKDEQGNRVSKLTDDEIVAQCFTFILAGYETTSNTLAFTSYLLALNPDKQDKLISEIDDAIATVGEELDYDTVQNLTYLDMVLQESLRLFPPGFRFGRECNESCTVNGQYFPKGCLVMVPAYCIHRDPEYWPEPLKFEPERFTAEAKQARHPYAHVPFGGGPRVCVGMRFAMLEAKMALVHILKQYRFEKCPETEVPVELHGTVTMCPKNGIYLRIANRV